MAKEFALVSPKGVDLEDTSISITVVFSDDAKDIQDPEEAKVFWAREVSEKFPLSAQEALYQYGWEVRLVDNHSQADV